MSNDDRDTLLLKISTKLAEIETKVNEVHKATFGNGHPGLNDRVLRLEEKNKHNKTTWVVIGFLIEGLISLAALFKG